MSNHHSNFILIPWQEDFLERLTDFVIEDAHGGFDNAIFIFPNSRPEKYLTRLIKQHPRLRRPIIVPRMESVGSLFSSLRSRIQSRPAWNAGLLDRVGLLLQCARDEEKHSGRFMGEKGVSFSFLQDAGQFFPWGVRLAGLFEECFVQNGKAENFLYLEGEVSPFASALLARLGNIFQRYVAGLEEREWTTPGRDASVVAEHLKQNLPLPDTEFYESPVYICGFHALTGTEDDFFMHLWEHGARVLLHGDPSLTAALDGRSSGSHWSCEVFRTWAKAWDTEIIALPAGVYKDREPRIRFYQGFDLHSQLSVMQKELSDLESGTPQLDEAYHSLMTETAGFTPEADDRAADTVVVMPDSGLLMPVLHHLPRTDINVSMGYPLARSPLFRLLDTLISLQEKRRNKLYYWRDLLDLIRHPYLKMLRPSPAEGACPDTGQPSDDKRAPLRIELHRLEQSLRGNPRRYVNPASLLEEIYQMMDADDLPPRPVLALLERLLSTCLDGFENKNSPAALGAALESLCSLLLDCGSQLWERFLIDAECLFRIMQSLIPELSRSVLAEDSFPPNTLLAILRRLVQQERVPFEASPLVGLQVMGMLETRLLSFRRVIIIDAGEDSLPGSPAGDPLLPDALRPEIGLPGLATREQVSSYHFFRLLAGAEEVLLLWQEGGDSPGIQEQKKKKSRFVEELIWNEEKKRRHVLSGREENSPLHHLASSIGPVRKNRRAIKVTPVIHEATLNLLSGQISASLLDSYLRCPVQFYYRYLAQFRPVEEIAEGDDPVMVGNLFHALLQDCYEPWVGRDLPGGKELHDLLFEEMTAALHASSYYQTLALALPADSAVMLLKAGEKRIRNYLLSQPPTRILAQESALAAPVTVLGRRFNLFGKADRVDLRQFSDDSGNASPGIHIIDYKTGRLPELQSSIWENDLLWERMAAWQPGREREAASGQAVIRDLAKNLQSVQLPYYLLLYGLGAAPPFPTRQQLHLCNAAWVELADKGEEKKLFHQNNSSYNNWDFVIDRGLSLTDFLLRHMLQSEYLIPAPGEHCRWCFSAKLCIKGED